ncbi:glycosyltransferase [Parasphingorhabdus flavimaris]|uniref:Glycosyltransferase n=1 Tax=Parasphingorhabdus flavimaris TaxID=266812 RepID=A0ABX2N0E9_9SPHN|nr:glycosyltransferase [Parasphingorhabdus flavimaris]NVD27187.1 glycosyltransferase [Parasphingorhabdus flavimaris]|tara:strand:+ start:4874 stop:6019 length:1146 start_codon:yes stop_codon:yes gene_type:complete
MKPAKILHLHSTFNLGGKEARAVRLMNHFGAAAEHVILSAEPESLSARDAIDAGIKVAFPKDAPSLAGKPSLKRYREFVSYFRQFDLILSYNWGSMDGVMARTIFSRVGGLPPLIHHEDGFNEDEQQKLNWKRNWFRKFALGDARALVVPSEQLAAIARDVWKQPEQKIQRIPNGIDVKRFAKKPQRGALPGFIKRDGEVVVGTVAGLRAIKNLPRLVRACAAAGDNVRLVIVGEGPEKEAILAEARRVGLDDRLLMPGFMADPARYIGLFDVFALSSDSEQFPISLIEAMAAGLPVAATDVGDIKSMVSQANHGFIKPLADEAKFQESLTTLIQHQQLREDLGMQNQLKAEAEYNESKMLGRYGLLYGHALGRAEFGAVK